MIFRIQDLPLRPRLQLTFTAITILVIFVLTLFSLVYFYKSTEDGAVKALRAKADVAQTLLDSRRTAVQDFASNLASDKTLQLLMDLDIGAKLSEFLVAVVAREKSYHISAFGPGERLISDVGFGKSQLVSEGRKVSPGEEKMVRQAFQGEKISALVQLSTAQGWPIPALSAILPVTRDRRIIGVVAVHFILADNPAYFHFLRETLGVDVALHLQGRNIAGSSELEVDGRDYLSMTASGRQFEKLDLIGAGLDNYRVLKDAWGTVAGVLHLHQEGSTYRYTFLTAMVFYLLFALGMILGVTILVVRFSSRILNPISTLMTGVQKISQGDLQFEILLAVKDEIGQLGQAFNEMRVSLSDKIQEVNALNQSLEAKVEQRTKQMEELNSKLKHYLSPQLYASLVGGERDASVDKHYRKKLTIFFSDVVNFTSTSDSLEPEDLSGLLNNYLDQMSRIAMKYGGTIDKYVGDAIMVFFGDPEFTSDQDHAVRAVSMSLEMVAKMDDLREEWTSRGITNPFHVRIGINTGYCTVGNFGSETKMDYTIIGNNVNLAARYEAAAEPDTVLMSHETYMLVKDFFEVENKGEYSLKGIPHPVNAYRPLRPRDARPQDWISLEEGGLNFRSRKVEISRLTPEEKQALRVQLADAARKLED